MEKKRKIKQVYSIPALNSSKMQSVYVKNRKNKLLEALKILFQSISNVVCMLRAALCPIPLLVLSLGTTLHCNGKICCLRALLEKPRPTNRPPSHLLKGANPT